MLVYNFLPKESLVSLTATTGKQAMRRDIVLSTLVAMKTQNVGSQQPLWSRFRCQCHVTYRGKGGRELYRDHTAAAAPALPPLQIYAQQIVQTAPLPSRSPPSLAHSPDIASTFYHANFNPMTCFVLRCQA